MSFDGSVWTQTSPFYYLGGKLEHPFHLTGPAEGNGLRTAWHCSRTFSREHANLHRAQNWKKDISPKSSRRLMGYASGVRKTRASYLVFVLGRSMSCWQFKDTPDERHRALRWALGTIQCSSANPVSTLWLPCTDCTKGWRGCRENKAASNPQKT